MKSKIVSLRKYIVLFVTCFLLLLMFIVIVACIPREKIKPRMLESAEYMCERRTSYLITNWIHASQMDRYADCITLSIAHQLDANKPLESAMWTSFYGGYSRSINYSLSESVRDDLPATHEYLRYWHGSAAAMRLLHLFWNIKTIYMFHAILMAAVSLILIILLFKNGFREEAVAYVLAMIIVSIWYVPLCLEYTYTFICMMVSAIIGFILALKHKDQWLGLFFMITGMVTVYFDFLTTETLRSWRASTAQRQRILRSCSIPRSCAACPTIQERSLRSLCLNSASAAEAADAMTEWSANSQAKMSPHADFPSVSRGSYLFLWSRDSRFPAVRSRKRTSSRRICPLTACAK